jgi:Zn-finger nucleic acid-binding protein
MKCPRCQNSVLQPTMIEELLPAMSCEQCEGSLVSLLYYRHWAETQKPTEAPAQSAPEAVPTNDATSALQCPKCARIMTKYKVSGSVANRLDLCSSCDEAWLDRGEWALLESLQLSRRIPAIFADCWQRRIRHEMSEEARSASLKRAIGEDGAATVEAFRAWLREHRQHKSDVLAYLYRE